MKNSMELKEKRIESNDEIVALLESLTDYLGADTGLLYKFIDKIDLEEIELLQLINSSRLWASSNNKEKINKLAANLGKSLNMFKKGNFIKNEHLKDEISILRFCDMCEKDPLNSRWPYDYENRPPKYIVFNDLISGADNDKIDKSKIEYLEDEGVTAFFFRYAKKFILNKKKTNKINAGKYKKSNSYDDDKKYLNYKALDIFEKGLGESKLGETYPCLFLSNEAIKSMPFHLNKDDQEKKTKSDVINNSKINTHTHHAAWILLIEDKDNIKEISGCLRFEFYNLDTTNNNLRDIDKKLSNLSSGPLMNIVNKEINSVLEKKRVESYDRQYNCLEEIIEELKSIDIKLREALFKCPKGKDEKNNSLKDSKGFTGEDYDFLLKLHSHIMHLFFIFKRNTIYGEAIIARVNKFIKVILEKLDLPNEMFSQIWDNLRKHEDLMLYNIENYRDHLMHQFHVFITGYIIIQYYGIEELGKQLNESMKNMPYKNNVDFTKKDILRIWTITSLFHDCGYAFEKLHEGFKTFSEITIGKPLASYFLWDRLILDNPSDDQSKNGASSMPILRIIEKMSNYFSICKYTPSKFNVASVLRILLQKAIIDHDHGVISAVILMQKYHSDQSSLNAESIESKEYIYFNEIFYLSALTIAIHNYPVYKTIHHDLARPICMKQNPFAFLLNFCDSIQEWGRKKKEDSQYKILLKKISLPDNVDEKSSLKTKEFTVILDYITDMNKENMLENYFQDFFEIKKNIFQSDRNCKFMLIYKSHNKGCKQPIDFNVCDQRCIKENV